MKALSIVGARIIDPASGYDGEGVITIEEGRITAIGADAHPQGEIIDGEGLIAAPGLIDMRVITGEPGREGKETLATAGASAAAGGVTTMVVMPPEPSDTRPDMDDVALIDFIRRRGTQASPVNILCAGPLLHGADTLAEIGLMQEAGAVMFAGGYEAVADSQIMRRLLAYSASFNALIAHRPVESALSHGTCAHESDLSSRLGLVGQPAISERIMIDRDAALVELTGGRLLVDMISSADAAAAVKRAKDRGLDMAASVSINHLCLNEVDIGDYRTFAKLTPPLRSEADRQALLASINDGTIDVIVSGHDPHPAGEKRLPFAEAAAGAVGLEILLAAGLSQVADGALDLMAFLHALTAGPAELLGLETGRLSEGAPADIILFDPDRPWICESEALRSKSGNTPFDGRRLTGRNVMTMVGGEVVYSL